MNITLFLFLQIHNTTSLSKPQTQSFVANTHVNGEFGGGEKCKEEKGVPTV